MNVCGLSIVTRKMLVMRQFGADAWGQFFRDVAGRQSCFRSLITADTLVPLPAFLAFHDELMRRFFDGGEASYLNLGRDASRWAVRDGPLKTLLQGSDLAAVVASLPKFHAAYFKEGTTWSEAAVTKEGVEFKVFGLPQRHPYFEHFVVGYIAEILEQFCANPIRPLRLYSGDNGYHYLLHGAPTDDAGLTAAGRARHLVAEGALPISKRELEVLLLVGIGRTNEEIGDALGISKKTAQHHVASAYRKLGVSGRVGAAVWLMEHRLIGD